MHCVVPPAYVQLWNPHSTPLYPKSYKTFLELLRAVPPLCSEEPELIMGLFIRLDAVHDLGLVDDRTFIIKILPLMSGSLLKFLGDSLRVGSDWAECKAWL